MTVALAASQVSASYGGVQALDDVSLEVEEGQIAGLIGPNGAGKTTLIDVVTGFTPGKGRIELTGTDISTLPPERRAQRGLGRTWQSVQLFDALTVRENLLVATRSQRREGGLRQRVTGRAMPASAHDETLALLGLTALSDAMPDSLSQGQRKLVGVARALAGEPRVLCLDEPAAGLDTAESSVLGQRLRDIAERGTAILLVDHDMGLVLNVCDRVYVLNFGRLIASDPPEVVRRDPNVINAYLGEAGAAMVTDPGTIAAG